MNKQMMVIGGAVIVIALLGIGAYFMVSKTSNSAEQMAPVDGVTSDTSSKASIKSLLGAGKNVTCTMTYPDSGGSGTIFVAGDKFRGDFTTVTNGQSMEGHMISDGGYMYSWSGAQGMKFKADAMASPPASGQTQNQSTDINKEVDMDCSNWSVDNSKFTPPGDVTFTDYSQMLEQTQTQTQTGTAPKMDSSVCNSIADAQAKAACLGAVGQ